MLEARPRVVVADDEEIIANTLAMILNQAGFEARRLQRRDGSRDRADVQAGYADFRCDHARHHWDRDGDQVAYNFASCKILLFSGQARTSNLLEKALTEGHEFEILNKPVHPSDLIARLRAPVPHHTSLLAPDR